MLKEKKAHYPHERAKNGIKKNCFFYFMLKCNKNTMKQTEVIYFAPGIDFFNYHTYPAP